MKYFYFFSSLFFALIPISQNIRGFHLGVDISYCIIVCWSLLAIFFSDRPSFSMYKIYYTFVLFFFGIAPYIQYSNAVKMWGGLVTFRSEDYFFTNVVILFIMTLFEFFYKGLSKTKQKLIKGHANLPEFKSYQIKLKTKLLLLIFSVASFAFTLILFNGNIAAMFYRGGMLDEQIEFNPLSQIVFNICRPFSLIVFMVYYNNVKRLDIFSIIFLAIGLLANFPTGFARYNAAALYIPFTLVVFPFFRKGARFNILMIFGLLIVFPFLDNFRYAIDEDFGGFNLSYAMFEEGHFDTYSSLMRVMKFDIITYGRQLLGVIFVWVPRSLWSNKPIGSGAFMSKQLDLNLDNISMNFFAEGYINFGFFGILLFVLFLSYFCAKLDNIYSTYSRAGRFYNKHFEVFYFIFTGFLIFILRGDLLSAFAYVCGYSVSFYIVYKIIMRNEHKVRRVKKLVIW
ncbi:hypothetical protein QE422_001384 [Chryseobacterium sp. SORGH_AS 447]|uniref:O-antigen polymerase n=1 Tax=Chryseobacterium sp. SORGH_AS_0447 TaxID=3041769 RepID=UPI0027823359|nr:O-antigen polymerase [Chryseobacterium sp. SORGH_AS_0447]MDQ1161016.1 hypothetical protein [Chryseobacterium sp. SORGH_AS_0447]